MATKMLVLYFVAAFLSMCLASPIEIEIPENDELINQNNDRFNALHESSNYRSYPEETDNNGKELPSYLKQDEYSAISDIASNSDISDSDLSLHRQPDDCIASDLNFDNAIAFKDKNDDDNTFDSNIDKENGFKSNNDYATAYDSSTYDKNAYGKSNDDKTAYERSAYNKTAFDLSNDDEKAYEPSILDEFTNESSIDDHTAFDLSHEDHTVYDSNKDDGTINDSIIDGDTAVDGTLYNPRIDINTVYDLSNDDETAYNPRNDYETASNPTIGDGAGSDPKINTETAYGPNNEDETDLEPNFHDIVAFDPRFYKESVSHPLTDGDIASNPITDNSIASNLNFDVIPSDMIYDDYDPKFDEDSAYNADAAYNQNFDDDFFSKRIVDDDKRNDGLLQKEIKDREIRSAYTVGRVFGKYVNRLMAKVLPWQQRIPVFTGAKFINQKLNVRHWEKPGGKGQFEKDFEMISRRRVADKPNVKKMISEGDSGRKVYRLQLESKTIAGTWAVDIITYL